MIDIARLFQAFLAPALFVSATALLILSICFSHDLLAGGHISYIREVIVALSSVHNEARDSRFMDIGTPLEIPGHHPP